MATKTAAAAIDAICAWRKEAVLPDEAAIYAGMAEISSDVFERDDLRLSAPTSAQDIEGWELAQADHDPGECRGKVRYQVHHQRNG